LGRDLGKGGRLGSKYGKRPGIYCLGERNTEFVFEGENMKKVNLGMAVAAAAAIILAGCASGPGANGGAKAAPEAGFSVMAYKTVVRDWQGRTLNEPPIPAWLGPATRGDFEPYQAFFKTPANSGIYRTSEAYGADVQGATMRADMVYARKIARELQQSINVYAAQSASSGGMTKATADAIKEKTSTETHVDITGHQKKTEFWQTLETADPVTGETMRNVVVYQVYEINPTAWTQTTAKYIKDVLGDLPKALTPEEKDVNALLDDMLQKARFPEKLSQEQALARLDAEKRMVDAQINLSPAQQKAAAQLELVKILEQGKTDRTQALANARTSQVQAAADAQETAYLSGNPVYTAAAVTTAADDPWVQARALAAPILF
jgi:hypothetical protein